MKIAKMMFTALACVISFGASGCATAQENTNLSKEDKNMSRKCNVKLSLYYSKPGMELGSAGFVDIWEEEEAKTPKQLASMFDNKHVGDYANKVVQELKAYGKELCSQTQGDVTLKLSFTDATNISAENIKKYNVPRYGKVSFDPKTGVLDALFVRSDKQTIADMYMLKTGKAATSKPNHVYDLYASFETYVNVVTEDHRKVPVKGEPLPDDKRLKEIDDDVVYLFESSDVPYPNPRVISLNTRKFEKTLDDWYVESLPAYVEAAKSLVQNAVSGNDVKAEKITDLIGVDMVQSYKAGE